MSYQLIMASFIVTTLFTILTVQVQLGRYRNKQSGEFINGFWKADPGWCSKAGISNVYATINFFPDKKHGVIYLLMQNKEGQVVDNDAYKFSTSVTMKEMLLSNQGNTECNLIFEDGKNPVSGMFPISCKLRMNVENGVMVLHDGKTVFLELFKDNLTSSRIERMTQEQFRERYLPERERTDPQADEESLNPSGLGESQERFLPEQPRTDPQADDGNSEGEDITPPPDESEGQMI